MRLLHTKDLTFKEFFDNEIPRYAILSHRWGEREVSYQDFLHKRGSRSSAWAKLRGFCKLAEKQGFSWAWIDTCCIDKTSSAELTESINSMWNWYGDAGICIVYLADVEQGSHDWTTHEAYPSGPAWLAQSTFEVLARSEWFERGWTLQELLAPRRLLFCTSNWSVVGDVDALSADIAKITGIPFTYLRRGSMMHAKQASIAMRMSWASKRKTARTEDMAYCLMGLFGVNMPLLYGERGKAFLRLQLEIIKKSDDQSIFAWRLPPPTLSSIAAGGQFPEHMLPSGMLAPSPRAFENSGNVINFVDHSGRTPPYQMTNKGLEIRLLSAKTAPARCPACEWNRELTERNPKLGTWSCQNVVLACGVETDVMDFLSSQTTAAMTAVSITLHKRGSNWERVNCDSTGIDDIKVFESVSTQIYELYYIPQRDL